MQIREIFSREIERDIKEVIKVDDAGSILEEIDEYVPTDHISEELVKALEVYQDTINNPSEEINIWISGFFGSGKSSFAKVLGYLISNPQVDGESVADRFFSFNEVPAAKALLNTIHSAAPTEAILLDLNTTPNVLQEGEPIVLPVYRTILQAFDYSRDITLAELEFDLETDGRLDQFSSKYEEVFDRSWVEQRDVITAKNRASRILHELDAATYPAADSWSNAAESPPITAKWFAARVLELLERRRPQKSRLILVVDEVGQYVSRSTDRMRHLQGLAEECQKTKGRLWLVATSQEKLTDVVDSLEGRQTELAKAQDRFPVRIDLLPSDIDEVTGKRVLDKTADGAKAVKDLLDANRNKVTNSVTLHSDRHSPFTEDDFIRLYPLVPYQLQVLIDAVSARRAQGGAPQTMGGSNRTLIRHAQQLLSNPSVGMSELPLGSLVTLDRSYQLLEDVIPTAWRHEVDQVAGTHGDNSLEARILRVIALCTDVPGVPLTERNLAVLLHPSMSSDSIESGVRSAVDVLVDEDRIKEGDDGFKLQSPEQKDWEKIRRGIDMKPGDAARLRKTLLSEALGSLTFKAGRTFKIELSVDREKLSEGDIAIDIRDEADVDGLRRTSRGEDGRHRIYWAFSTSDETWDSLAELHRSVEMIDRYDNAGASDAERVLVAEERKRRDRSRKSSEQLLFKDVTSGTTIFDGNSDDAPEGGIRSSVNEVVAGLLAKIYPSLDVFAGSFKKADILRVLSADSLAGLPDSCGPDGLEIFRITAGGRELIVDSGPIDVVTSYIDSRKRYGEDQNGGQLERYFGSPPYGASVETLQVVLAAALRAGLIEVVSQASRITTSTDQRLEQVFGSLPKFRAASYRPAEETGPSLDVRGEVSEWLSKITGEPSGLDVHELAETGRETFGPLLQPCTEVRSFLAGASLEVPGVLLTMDELLSRIMGQDDDLAVETMRERSSDLELGRSEIALLAELIESDLDTLRQASKVVQDAGALERQDAEKDASELGELLARARYAEDIAQIRTRTTELEQSLAEEEEEARSILTTAVETATSSLRSRYPSLDDGEFADQIRPFEALASADSLDLIRANGRSVAVVARGIAEVLDTLSTTRTVQHIRIADVWTAPITSAEDLELALNRIREAVLDQLDEDTEVKLR